jgi:hypothetical protein
LNLPPIFGGGGNAHQIINCILRLELLKERGTSKAH